MNFNEVLIKESQLTRTRGVENFSRAMFPTGTAAVCSAPCKPDADNRYPSSCYCDVIDDIRSISVHLLKDVQMSDKIVENYHI